MNKLGIVFAEIDSKFWFLETCSTHTTASQWQQIWPLKQRWRYVWQSTNRQRWLCFLVSSAHNVWTALVEVCHQSLKINDQRFNTFITFVINFIINNISVNDIFITSFKPSIDLCEAWLEKKRTCVSIWAHILAWGLGHLYTKLI